MNATTEPTHRTTDKRVVNLTDDSKPDLPEGVAVQIGLCLGLPRTRVEELWQNGQLSKRGGLDWSLACDIAQNRNSSVSEINSQIIALLGGDSKDLDEAIRLQAEADALAAKASERRTAAISKREEHLRLKEDVRRAGVELQKVGLHEAGVPEAIAEVRGYVSCLVRDEPFGKRAIPPHVELSGLLALKAELPAIRKSAESAVKQAEKALSEFERANGITTSEQEAA